MSHVTATPVGGKLTTPFFNLMALVALVGVAALVIRFGQGLGAATGMTDGYAWGIWIALDVVVGTALGCGGYAMALLVYVAQPGEVPPAGPPGHAHRRARLRLRGDLDHRRPGALLGHVEDPHLRLLVELRLGASRGRALRDDLRAGALDRVLAVDPRALARLRDPWPASFAESAGAPARPGPALHHRPRPAAPHHAPVVAGHGDDAALLEDAPALVHRRSCPCSSW